jgi:hypothetical protein
LQIFVSSPDDLVAERGCALEVIPSLSGREVDGWEVILKPMPLPARASFRRMKATRCGTICYACWKRASSSTRPSNWCLRVIGPPLL